MHSSSGSSDTDRDKHTHTCVAPVAATSLNKGEPATQEQETSAVTPVSVAVETDIQECERMWRKTHTH